MKGIVCLDVIVFSLLCFLAVEQAAQGLTTCPGGQWGDNCEYRCHCASGQCDRDSGACADQCDVGWHEGQGQTCQQRNVALGKNANSSSASQSQTPDPSFKVVDGNRSNQGDAANDTCVFTTSGLKYVDWTVDLDEDYTISSILLVFRDTGEPPRRKWEATKPVPVLAINDADPVGPCHDGPIRRKDTVIWKRPWLNRRSAWA